jgi:hypothetical protein
MPIFTAPPSENTVKNGRSCRFSVIFWLSHRPGLNRFAASGVTSRDILESMI